MEKTEFLKEMDNPERFKNLDDGWIQDSLTGLDWGPSSEDVMDFNEANEYCEKLGARLPESHELMSLIDHSKRKPACLLDDMKYDDWYWTSTPVSGYPEGAWCVPFIYGGVYVGSKGSGSYVRPVRASQ